MRGIVAFPCAIVLLCAAILGAGRTTAAPAPLHFDCQGPINPAMPAGAILARYGKDARREILAGAEGSTTRAVVLYPDDPSRRLEITFWDDAQTAVANITARGKAVAWIGPLGLHAGSSMAEVVAANGHNFSFTGFGWDYGGYLTNVWTGKLLKQGCAIQIRLAPPTGVHPPKSISGERELNSTLAEVKAIGPVIGELSIGWPLPAGVKASGDGVEN